MRVVIAGGHGKIALLAERLLAGRGDQVAGLIRNPAHAADVQEAGAEAVVCDLETASAEDVAVLLSGAAAVVFAAGAGPGSGASRKDSVDRGASVLMADAAERAGVRRFVQISSMGAGQPPTLGFLQHRPHAVEDRVGQRLEPEPLPNEDWLVAEHISGNHTTQSTIARTPNSVLGSEDFDVAAQPGGVGESLAGWLPPPVARRYSCN